MSGQPASGDRVRRFIDALKYAPWLTRERCLLWATAFGATWFFLLVFDFATHSTHGVMNAKGEHIGRDFINYWSGAKEALAGRAAAVYNLNGFHAFQQSLVGRLSEWKMYSYPPVLMLLTLPLGVLPFLPAYFLWSGVGIALGTLIVRRQTGWEWPLCLLAAFAPPAAFWNLLAGQNGYFTAALLAGGLMMIERRPAIAGVLFGLLSYKPQMGLLIPVALLAGRHWRCFGMAAVTVLILGGASTLFFGLDPWHGFRHQMQVQQTMMEMKRWFRMPTVFESLGVIYVPWNIAFVAQAVSTVLAAALVAFIWRGRAHLGVKASALCVAAFLATPYAWDYDMVVLTSVAIWMVQEGQRTGFLPWEKLAWLLLIILPIPLMSMAQYMGFQPAPLVLWLALALILRRAKGATPGLVTP